MRPFWWSILSFLPALMLGACKPTTGSTSQSGIYKKSDSSIFQPPPRTYARPSAGSSKSSVASQYSDNLNIAAISIEDLFKLQQSESALIIDARDPYYYGLGHIPSAVNLPAPNCERAFKRLDAEFKDALKSNKTIIVYCSGLLCKDARTVARHIALKGYTVHKFYGGWSAWQDANLPSEKNGL